MTAGIYDCFEDVYCLCVACLENIFVRRMVSSGLLRRVALVLVLTRATRRNNPEDTILHSHRRENLKSYMFVRTS
jgi:hypothetical protein